MPAGILRKARVASLLPGPLFIQARVREIWKMMWASVAYFSRSVAWRMVNDNGSQSAKISFA